MATIRKRGRSWQVQVRHVGFPTRSKSFSSKAAAVAWAQARERDYAPIEDHAERPGGDSLTVAGLLQRYQIEITALKRGYVSENCRINNMLEQPVAKVSVRDISSRHFAEYRNSRIRKVGPDTVRRELTIFRHCFEIARKEWDITIAKNPLHDIRFPAPGLPREERLSDVGAADLHREIGTLRNKIIASVIVLAIETGMRRGELLSLRWKDVDLEKGTVRLLQTKNGRPRTVPLTPRAIEELRRIERKGDSVLQVSSNAVQLCWNRIRVRAGLGGLRFHDLRHEAISRFFELELLPIMLDRMRRIQLQRGSCDRPLG
ncbi:integrase family protein [Methylorubrum extorquens DSM 13060]|uniref:Integrase family protein n=2 Tax=Methylorubrum extorquens TaxID=408 RepID=H1KR96_METEX|nr:integrase family protein [Methylorubrum extorquens DSM 13060]